MLKSLLTSLLCAFQFQDYAAELVEVSQINAENLFKSFHGLSLGLTAYAMGAQEQWPFVTLPIFGAQVQGVLDLGSDWVSLVTLVQEDDRLEWENYTVSNQGWIQEDQQTSNAAMKSPSSSSSSILASSRASSDGGSITPYIFRTHFNGSDVPMYRDEGPPIDPEYYAPMWQIAPADTAKDHVNYNQFDNEEFQILFDELVSRSENDTSSSSSSLHQGAVSRFLADWDNFTDVKDWPHVYTVQPVYDSTADDAMMVGVVTSYLPFHVYLMNILPENVNGIVLVMRNTCAGRKEPDQEFSYTVNGPDLVFMGPGDLHSRPRWTFHEYAAEVPVFRTTSNCTYSMHMYPSDEFYEVYDSNRPAVYTSIVVLIFLMTAFAFIWYDCSVDQRQDKVETSAARTNAIVDSFFPSHVRERIMRGDEGEDPESNLAMGGLAGTNKKLGKVFGTEIITSKPIADLFPNASVM